MHKATPVQSLQQQRGQHSQWDQHLRQSRQPAHSGSRPSPHRNRSPHQRLHHSQLAAVQRRYPQFQPHSYLEISQQPPQSHHLALLPASRQGNQRLSRYWATSASVKAPAPPTHSSWQQAQVPWPARGAPPGGQSPDRTGCAPAPRPQAELLEGCSEA